MSNPRARIRELERLENLEKIELLEKTNKNKLNKIIADLLVFQIEKTVELKDYYLKNEILYYSKKSKNSILIAYNNEHDYSDGYPIDILNIDTKPSFSKILTMLILFLNFIYIFSN